MQRSHAREEHDERPCQSTLREQAQEHATLLLHVGLTTAARTKLVYPSHGFGGHAERQRSRRFAPVNTVTVLLDASRAVAPSASTPVLCEYSAEREVPEDRI